MVQCVNCDNKALPQELSSKQSLNLILNTNYQYRLRLETSSRGSCLETLRVRENGKYLLYVESPSIANSTVPPQLKCTLTVERAPNNVAIPLIVGIVIIVVLFIGCLVTTRFKLIDRLSKKRVHFLKRGSSQLTSLAYDLQAPLPATASPTVSTDATPKPTKTKRLLSLDAFRGFGEWRITKHMFRSSGNVFLALIAMIFVNYGSGGYAEFEHGPWHGITFADIVFPFFVWMLGTSMVISLKNASDRSVSKRSTLIKAAIRTLKLFVSLTFCRIDRLTPTILCIFRSLVSFWIRALKWYSLMCAFSVFSNDLPSSMVWWLRLRFCFCGRNSTRCPLSSVRRIVLNWEEASNWPVWCMTSLTFLFNGWLTWVSLCSGYWSFISFHLRTARQDISDLVSS